MKKLYLVRHGKSDWEDIDLNDLERPLKERGVRNSHEIGQLMKSQGEIPNLLISSPAVRAFDTAKILAEELDIPSPYFKVDEKLYLPDFPTLLKTVLYLSNDFSSVLLVGHEPSLSTFIDYFIDEKIDKVVTASLTSLTFETAEWRDLSPANCIGGHHSNRHNMKGSKLK